MAEQRGTKSNPYHVSCGAIVYRKSPAGTIDVLVLHRFRAQDWPYENWHLPKGTKLEEESEEQAVARTVGEETSYPVNILGKVGVLNSTYELDNTLIHKTTHYFVCTPSAEPKARSNEYDEVVWVQLDRAINLLPHTGRFEQEGKILLLFKQQL